MAIIDYLGVENAIKSLLEADSRTEDNTVEVEPEFMLIPDKCPYVAIYLDSYETLANTETIGGTKPYLTGLNIQIWCYTFSFENLDGATRRDSMLGNVKEVIKDNDTLSDTVLYWQFGTGEFDNQKNTAGLGFFKGVSLSLLCQIKE
jgi:hypothetical protein